MILLYPTKEVAHYFFNSNGLWITSLLGIFSRPSKEVFFMCPASACWNFLKKVEFTEPEITEYRSGYIGFVFQRFNLINDLTVRENIEIPLLIKREKQDYIEEHVMRSAEIRSRIMPEKNSTRT